MKLLEYVVFFSACFPHSPFGHLIPGVGRKEHDVLDHEHRRQDRNRDILRAIEDFFCNFPNIDSSFRNPETALRDSVTFYLQISEALTHSPLKLSGNLGRATEQLTPATEWTGIKRGWNPYLPAPGENSSAPPPCLLLLRCLSLMLFCPLMCLFPFTFPGCVFHEHILR